MVCISTASLPSPGPPEQEQQLWVGVAIARCWCKHGWRPRPQGGALEHTTSSQGCSMQSPTWDLPPCWSRGRRASQWPGSSGRNPSTGARPSVARWAAPDLCLMDIVLSFLGHPGAPTWGAGSALSCWTHRTQVIIRCLEVQLKAQGYVLRVHVPTPLPHLGELLCHA